MKLKPLRLQASERQVLRACLGVLRDWGLARHVQRQNTGGFVNASGQYVACGQKGNSDLGGLLPEGWGVASGKRIVIEVKREGFKPPSAKCYDGRPMTARAMHWLEQWQQMMLVNNAGGYGFWCDESGYLWKALHLIRQGYRVTIGANEQPEFFEP